MGELTKREFFRQETTSEGSEVASRGCVVVAEASYERGGLTESAIASAVSTSACR